MKPQLKVSKPFILKSNTNEGDKSKQYCVIMIREVYDAGLSIKRLTLTKHRNSYLKLGFKVIKKYKGMYLMQQLFSVKLKSLNKIIKWMTGKNKEK